MADHVLALDQGTTSSRSIVFSKNGLATANSQQEFPQIFPQPGHVEHDPEAIWESQLATAKQAIAESGCTLDQIAALGITNQRETTILWERASGKPVANAIVWQSRITSDICEQLRRDGHEETFKKKTGLVLDAYFSGTKIQYLLDQIDGLRSRAERGEILFGTVDTFLAWRLSGGKLHITDVSNASRTLLFNIHTLEWDDELLGILNVPRAMLPEVRSSSEVYGETDPALFGAAIPIAYQTRDVLGAMEQDSGGALDILRVDGGATANGLLMQFQADLLGVSVQRPVVSETTALGAAYLAGLATGVWESQADVSSNWQLDTEFQPSVEQSETDQQYADWQRAVARSLDWAQ
jgi:glycerol kinase